MEETEKSWVTRDEVAAARNMMRAGMSLKRTAERLKVPARELDLAMWRLLGVPLKEPMW